MVKIIVICILFLINSVVLFAEQENCYVAVESAGSYDQLTVTTIALTMIRQFVDPNVQPAPTSGFSSKACTYLVNVLEQETGIKVFILGAKISDYGKSQLRGEPGLEQAVLRGILKSLNEQTITICKKYGSVLEDECQGNSASVNLQVQDNSQGQNNSQNRRIPPDCQKKEGVQLPEKCKMFYEQGFGGGQNQQGRPIPPDCQKKEGKRLPKHCKRFYEQGFGGGQNQQGQRRPIPPDCQLKEGEEIEDLPGRCKRFYENGLEGEMRPDKKKPPGKKKKLKRNN